MAEAQTLTLPSIHDAPREEPIPMSYEDFLAWDTEDLIVEWQDGKVIIQMPPNQRHQLLVMFLLEIMGRTAKILAQGQVMIPPFEVKLPDGLGSREPDLFFVSTDNQDKFDERRLNGAPDLAVEIVSASSVNRDRQEKFRAYEAAGVAEYWIIDPRPDRRHADFFQLADDGRYVLFATADDDVVHSPTLSGFWLRPDWLWQHPLPDVLGILAQIIGTERLIEHIRQSSATL